MIDFGDGNTMMSRELKRWIPEYPLHFLDLSTFGHFEYFRTELRPLLELFQRRGSRKKFMEYLEQNEEYWDMDDESWHMLGQLTNFKNIENFLKRKNERDKEEKDVFITKRGNTAEPERRSYRAGDPSGGDGRGLAGGGAPGGDGICPRRLPLGACPGG